MLFFFSGMLIFKMEGFEGTKRQAQKQGCTEKLATELAALQLEVESLKKQREVLCADHF